METVQTFGGDPRVVFVATDLSEPADQALREASERARRVRAHLIVCHIVPDLLRTSVLFPQQHAAEAVAQLELRRAAHQAVIERATQVSGRQASELEIIVDQGTPYARIVEHAERAQADLIVLGSRGATGLTRLVLGSVAERVARYAHAQVLIVRAGTGRTGRVLVATDLSDPSLPAIAAAAREAREPGVSVTVLHCIDIPAFLAWRGLDPAPVVLPDVLEGVRERMQSELEQAMARFHLQGEPRVSDGSPVASIVATAEQLGADLVILGTHGRTGLRRVALGSVAESVIRHAPCSVLVVRLHQAQEGSGGPSDVS